jgi:hypothetical protein
MQVVRLSVTHYFSQLTLSVKKDFPTIKLGHLKLVKEVAEQNILEYRDIPHKTTGAVKRRVPVVVGFRRVHQARVVGFQEDFTAFVYEGSDFEKAGGFPAQARYRSHKNCLAPGSCGTT